MLPEIHLLTTRLADWQMFSSFYGCGGGGRSVPYTSIHSMCSPFVICSSPAVLMSTTRAGLNERKRRIEIDRARYILKERVSEGKGEGERRDQGCRV